MSDFRSRVASALSASGYQVRSDEDRLTPLANKLELLRSTGRYARLISDLLAANDGANLRSLVLEVTFAYQFENVGLPLRYEVRHRQDDETSVDFLREDDLGKKICIEMRLVQQRQAITNLFEEQLRSSPYFGTTLNGAEDRAETLRLQRLILEKAVNSRGELIKFAPGAADSYNVAAIEVSELHLGMIDDADCLLATYGDPAVHEFMRHQLFGLFQEVRPEYPLHIHELARRFAPFRAAVHAVLFLRKVPPGSPINFRLEYLLVHNRMLMTTEEATRIARDIHVAMNVWKSVRERA
jgi:hypothetical protein